MSVRLTKKSVVSAPGRSVKTPCFVPPWLVPMRAHAAHQHHHLRRRQAHELGAVEHQLLRADDIVRLHPVAVAVGQRLERSEGLSVGHLRGRIAAARAAKGTATCETGRLGRLLDADIAGQHDDVGEARTGLRRRSARGSPGHLRQARRLVALPVLLRGEADACTVGAAARSPSWRKVRALSQAVATMLGDRQARGGDLRLEGRDVVGGGAGGDGVLPDQVLRPARRVRCSAPSVPCRGGSA